MNFKRLGLGVQLDVEEFDGICKKLSPIDPESVNLIVVRDSAMKNSASIFLKTVLVYHCCGFSLTWRGSKSDDDAYRFTRLAILGRASL